MCGFMGCIVYAAGMSTYVREHGSVRLVDCKFGAHWVVVLHGMASKSCARGTSMCDGQNS